MLGGGGHGTVVDSLAMELSFKDRTAQQIPAMVGNFNKLSTGSLLAAGSIATIGVAAVGAFFKSVHAATQFESAWAEVRTIMSATAGEARHLSEEILELSTRVPESAVGLSKAYYQVISAGITDTSKALYVLETASKAATAGITSTFTAVDILTTIINAYGKSAYEAGRVADILFTTVREGKTTFEQLGSSLGIVIPFFAQAGVRLEELAAAMATLTKFGLSTEIATTALRATITSLIKPTAEAKSLANELGIEFGAAAVKSKGFVGFLNDVKKATGGNIEILSELFPNVRALASVLNLTGKAAEEFNRQFDIMLNQSQGNSIRAFKIMDETLEEQGKIVKNKLEKGWIDLGNTTTKVIAKIFNVSKTISQSTQAQLDHYANVAERMRFLDGRGKELVATYEKLIIKEKEGEVENEKLRSVIKELASAYPALVSQVNRHGEAIRIDIPLLKQYRDLLQAQLLLAKSDVVRSIAKDFGKNQTEFEKTQKRAEELREALLNLKDKVVWSEPALHPGGTGKGGWIANITMDDGSKVRGWAQTREEAMQRLAQAGEEELSKLQTKLEQLGAQYATLEVQIAQFAEDAGLGDVVKQYADFNDKTKVALKPSLEDAAKLKVLLGSLFDKPVENLDDYRKLLIDVATQVDALRQQRTMADEEGGAATPAIGPGGMAAKAFVAGITKKDEAELREYMKSLGYDFSDTAWAMFKRNETNAFNYFVSKFDALKEKREKQEENAAKKFAETLAKEIEKGSLMNKLAKLMGENAPPELKRYANYSPSLVAGVVATPYITPPDKGDRTKDASDAINNMMQQVNDLIKDAAINAGELSERVKLLMRAAVTSSISVSKMIDEVPDDLKQSVLNMMIELAKQGAPIDPKDLHEAILKTKWALQFQDAIEGIKYTIIDATKSLGPLGEGLATFVSNLMKANNAFKLSFKENLKDSLVTVATSGAQWIASNVVSGFLTSVFGGQTRDVSDRLRQMEQDVKDYADTLSELDFKKAQEEVNKLSNAYKLMLKSQLSYSDFFKRASGTADAATRQAVDEYLKVVSRALGISMEDALKMVMELGLDPVKQQVSDLLKEAKDNLAQFGKYLEDTWSGITEKMSATFDILDITDPMKQLQMMFEAIEKFAKVDLSPFKDLSPENMEKATQLLAALMTGVLPADQTDQAMQQLAAILGITIAQLEALIQAIREGGYTSEELIAMMKELESQGDAVLQHQKEISNDQTTVSRNVSITGQQGDTIVAAMNSIMVLMRSIVAAIGSVTQALRNLDSASIKRDQTQPMNQEITLTTHINVQGGDQPKEVGKKMATVYVSEVETLLRSKGIKISGQGR